MMGEHEQPDQQLRIQLEGQLEVVESMLRRAKEASLAIKGDAWQTDQRWHHLAEQNVIGQQAVQALRQKIAEQVESCGAGLVLEQLEHATAEAGRRAAERLSEVGIPTHAGATTQHVIARLRQQLPHISSQYVAEAQGGLLMVKRTLHSLASLVFNIIRSLFRILAAIVKALSDSDPF